MRTFPDIINEWTNLVQKENHKFKEPETGLLIMRLGTLGQRLIYEANLVGMNQTADMIKAKRDEQVCKDIDSVIEGLVG